MEWINENWLWLLLGGGMVAMHLFGHRGHAGGCCGGMASKSDGAQGDDARDGMPSKQIRVD
jgi:hypothetical protein